ncbi:unnamed protein product [Amoebophrya sp. A25]|nr:unnamed protein product [Amoebophrya sp. A25]|eukprot:GSA25T00015459001.1
MHSINLNQYQEQLFSHGDIECVSAFTFPAQRVISSGVNCRVALFRKMIFTLPMGTMGSWRGRFEVLGGYPRESAGDLGSERAVCFLADESSNLNVAQEESFLLRSTSTFLILRWCEI